LEKLVTHTETHGCDNHKQFNPSQTSAQVAANWQRRERQPRASENYWEGGRESAREGKENPERERKSVDARREICSQSPF